ncbi:MAG: hypothetical protein RBT36_05855 [Desulfobulbus sp.]|nr:hypothetical protein [Desulfobulbus sp.]
MPIILIVLGGRILFDGDVSDSWNLDAIEVTNQVAKFVLAFLLLWLLQRPLESFADS